MKQMITQVQHGEKFNTASHAVGAFLALMGCVLLLFLAAQKQDTWKLFSFTVYALTTVGLYCISTIYHGSRAEKKEFYRKLDYIGIYLKIAGSYTPYAILALRGTTGWIILGVVWTLAVLGIMWEVVVSPKNRTPSLLLYAVMAATVAPALKHLMDAIPPIGFALVLAGFISYGIGMIFFLNDEKIKHGHGMWHLCVMAGTGFQYLCLLMYIA
ncbi:PAQR family membrane homeostasis protein TrhA [Bdellovibrio reynosensis]|uniref:Hemolysin III family protein n=1 Tax=Bdellovibrio reynosensis TaxID=2835041 RepID=A0ABY4C6D6_9BACT|nr:hemolysin III family protein [Bdellovibrio reynosensis]UOF00507.1 hemolysin III family protein [Bdellovibrio reynosensis]